MNLEKIFKNLVRAQLLFCFGYFIYGLYAGALNDTSLAADVVISSSEVALLICGFSLYSKSLFII